MSALWLSGLKRVFGEHEVLRLSHGREKKKLEKKKSSPGIEKKKKVKLKNQR